MKTLIFTAAALLWLNAASAQNILTLDKALETAFEKSYNIKAAKYSLISSQKNLEALKRGLMTSVNLEFDLPSYQRTLTNQFNQNTQTYQFYELGYTTFEGRLSFTQPIALTNGTFSLEGTLWKREQFNALQNIPQDYYSNLSFRLRQPLFTFNTLQASLSRAEINLLKSERNFKRAEKDIVYEVTAGFYRVYQAKKNAEITSEKVKKTEASYNTAINKFKAGLIAEVEALQLEIDLAASKNELLSAERNYQEALDEFKLLIGLSLKDQIDVETTLDYKPVTVDVQEAVASALANRTELMNSEADITLRNLSVDEVDSRGNISALLSANYGINKTDRELGNLFNDFADNRSLVFTVSVPVLDWGRNSREVEAAQAELDLAKLNYKFQAEQIEREIIAVVNKLESSKARVEVLSKTVELAEKSYEISMGRFQSGTITSFDLSQMQLRLTDARVSSLNALIDYQLALADLKRKTLTDY